MTDTNFFDRLDQVVEECQRRLDRDDINLAEPLDISEHIAYGTTRDFHFKIATRRGKNTRAYYHVVIYRLETGRYELTAYWG